MYICICMYVYLSMSLFILARHFVHTCLGDVCAHFFVSVIVFFGKSESCDCNSIFDAATSHVRKDILQMQFALVN